MDGTKRLRSQRLAVALIGGAMLLGGVGIGRAAWAQAPQPGDVGDPSGQVPQDPGEDCTQASADTGLSSATGGSGCDTQFTPIAKDGSKLGWTQIAGAVHGEATSPDGHASRDAYTNTIQSQKAPIPATVDFYTVSFLNPSFGLAGGAQCRREPPDGTGGEALTQFLDECERVPVIYRYTDNTENGPFWEEAYRGDEPGFVGAISWLHNLDTKEHGQRALAVGGTGSPSATCPKTQPGCPGYPRREPGMSDDPANADDSNCAEEGAKNAKVLEVDPEGDSPKGATWGPGGPLDAPRVDTNQTIAKQGDPQEALAECEDNWRKTHDPAGKGRAWLLTDSQWQELDAPSDMRGQSALDAALDVGNCQGATAECAFAGGLQQIWMWKDGGFDRLPWRPDGPSRPLFGPPNFNTPCTSSISCEWHFRVRAIRFKPGNAGGATAITSGCCSLNPDTNTGRTLSFERNTGLWRVQGRKALGVVGNTTSCFVPHCGPQRLPDSLYAMTESGGSMLASPGGPERPDEPPSQISGGSSSAMAGDSVPYDATRHYLSSARLVAGAADFRQHQQTPVDRAGGKATLTTIDSGSNDALMDWAVGGFKGTDRAAGYTTTTQAYGAGRAAPFPVDCPEGTLNGTESNPNTASGCKPNDKAAEQTKSGYLFSLSSYFLNGLAMAGDTGIGWGVGDRGAIERLAGNSAAAGGTLRPEGRPKLGPRQLGGVPPREPYTEAERDSAAEPGTVPALNGQPSERLPNPRLIPYGSPNPHSGQMGDETVKQIAMSRDGAEGWAIGPKVDTPNQTTTLYRFDGARWRRCGTDEVEGVLDADPACKALWPLRHHQNGVRLTAIARVPMEYGSDPTHADDFEAIAAGTPDDLGRQPIIRYREGRWTVDETATNEVNGRVGGSYSPPGTITDIAFSGPDDGWMVADYANGEWLFRFDGRKWMSCGPLSVYDQEPPIDRDGCADHNAFIPDDDFDNGAKLHLTSSGDRIYLYGGRDPTNGSGVTYPFVLYKNPGPCRGDGDPGCWQHAYDPGCVSQEQNPQDPQHLRCVADRDRSVQGEIKSLSVALGPDGSYNGWGVGWFGGDAPKVGNDPVRAEKAPGETPFIRSDSDGTHWRMTKGGGPADDYLLPPKTTNESGVADGPRTEIVALPGDEGKGPVFAAPSTSSPTAADRPTLRYDPAQAAWRVLEAPYGQVWGGGDGCQQAAVQAMAPDNAGGLWLTAGASCSEGEAIFYRLSDRAAPDLFEERAHPVREQITAATGGPDGSFWLATDSEVLYRYDRQTGWDRMRVPGWDPGRVRTVTSPAHAIAIGPNGTGVVVGKNGRIADVGPGGAILDAAAGVLCSQQEVPTPPCGTGRDLHAAAIAPDGSALVGGSARSLLYREGASGAFHAIPPPSTRIDVTLTGISMPRTDRAWIVTESGEIYGGTLVEGVWGWKREDTDRFGDSITRDERRRQQPLRNVAIDADGTGYAVGDHGTIVKRTGDGATPWRRIDAGYLDDLTAVTLGPGGKGALLGGDLGLLLTLDHGRFEPARFAHRHDPTQWGYIEATARMQGVALLPGYKDGQIEAWAATQVFPATNDSRSSGTTAILHYSSDPSEPLMDGLADRATPIADTPPVSADALSFAAFGNTTCQYTTGQNSACPELTGSNEAHDLMATRIRDELLADSGRPDAPDFSLFTGDVGDAAITRKNHLTGTFLDEDVIHDRWVELIANPLNDAGRPLFGAIGGRDLATGYTCQWPGSQGICAGGHQTRSGANLAWRRSMVGMPSPWGALGNSAPETDDGLSFIPVDTGGTKKELEDTPVEDPTKAAGGETIEDPTKAAGGQTVEDPTPTGTLGDRTTSKDGAVGDQQIPERGLAGDQSIPTGGAHTHYALDVKRGDQALLRLVVLDTSLKSLAASDAQQNPVEEQLGWLKDALQRPEGQRAVVLTNTPTYSYGPGANGETVTEGTVLESILMQTKVDLVVDGRLGWNALYYALAPGVHWPCPGSPYPSGAPSLGSCNGVGPSEADKALGDAQKDAQQKAAELTGGAVASGALPFLIAHSAGGKFGPEGQSSGSVAEGFWRGYSVVHLDTKTGEVQIEQRPVFDWIGLSGKTHVLRPNQKTPLSGYGREALGIDQSARYDDISSPAITHCYDLVLADPDKPWLPLKAEDAEDEQLAAQGEGCQARRPAAAQLTAEESDAKGPCDPYVCLSSSVGTIDDQSGVIAAGNESHDRTFAIAILSVGQKVASYPISFEPRPSFTPEAPPPPPPPSSPPPPPPPPPPPGNQLPQINLPAPPAIPSLPIDAGLVPPVPPGLPPPPGASSATPLNLFLSTPGINLSPQSTVVPPPAPPIQPAPPGGARKEARQKQAATQDSGAGADQPESGSEAPGSGDLAQGPPEPKGSAMTRRDPNASMRRDRVAPGQSFTPLAHHGQSSAWARDLQWGGGLTLMALVLALGFTTVRPGSRRRQPEIPAPARVWSHTRRDR